MRVDKTKWTTKQISSFFDLQMGRTPSRKSLELWENGDTPWVSIADMSGTRFISSTKEKLSAATIKQCNIPIIPVGTVIMSFKLTIGKTCITNVPLTTNEAIMAFYPKKDVQIDNSFLCYALSALKWKGNRAVKGVTINKKTISQKVISLPDFTEQQAIASELDAVQEMIDGYKAQIADLDVLAQSIFLDMFGDPVSNPKGWEISLFYKVCDVRDGTHDSPKYYTEGIPLVTSKNLIEGNIDFTNAKFIAAEDAQIINKRSKVDNGDIIMPMIGAIGNPIIVNEDRPFCIKNVALIKFCRLDISNVYIKYLLSSKPFDTYMHNINKGVAQKFVSLKTIRNFHIPVPPLVLQQQFAAQVEALEKRKELLRQQLSDAETLMAERMQYYFS